MEIVPHPHPALAQKSKPITRIDARLKKTIAKMFELMYEANGIGLAANQVGLPFRFFVINLTADPEKKEEEVVFINPEIIKRKGQVEDEEGCLSLPQVYGPVRRSEEIVVETFTLKGEGVRMTLNGLFSRAVQHELDHLDGVMFPDRMTEDDKAQIADEVEQFENHFRNLQRKGELPSDEEIQQQLDTMMKTDQLFDPETGQLEVDN